jgi:hypothetical protein
LQSELFQPQDNIVQIPNENNREKENMQQNNIEIDQLKSELLRTQETLIQNEENRDNQSINLKS